MPKRSRGLRSMLSLASPEKEIQDQTSCTRNSEFSNLMQFKSSFPELSTYKTSFKKQVDQKTFFLHNEDEFCH